MSGPFLRNPYLLGLSILILLVAGLSAFLTLPRLEDPRIVHRFPVILAPFPGASAERVEALITERIENALDEISEVKLVESTSRSGFASIRVELEDSVVEGQNREIFARIRSKLDEVEPTLPQEAPEPTLDDQRIPAAYTWIEALVFTGEGEPPLAILSRMAEELGDRMRRVPGTELVRLYGEPQEEITVLADASELEALGLSAAYLASRASAADVRLPAGALRTPADTILVEVAGAFDTLERVRAIPLNVDSDGSLLRIGDIATVERGVRHPLSAIALVDGAPAVLVAARMAPDERISDWASATRQVVEDFAPEVGGAVELTTVFDQSVYTDARLGELAFNLLLGGIVVVFVVFLTMGWRLSLLVGSALPLTACGVLFAISMLGGQLHQMSIFGMIIALGLLIDNAIVMVDEIRKRRENGFSASEALADASRHLMGPLFASTLTTALAFAPIVLLPGAAGDFVGYIGISVILAVSFSLLLSMTVIAALAGRFGRFHSGDGKRSWWRHGLPGERLAASYRRAMNAGMKVPVVPILIAMALPVLGFVVSRQLGSEFFPPTDRNMFDIQVWLPNEVAIDRTLGEVRAMEEVIRHDEAVRHVHWMIGESFPPVYYNLVASQDNAPYYARAVVEVDTADDTARLLPTLQQTLDERFPGAQVVARSYGQGPPVEAGVQYRLFGPSVDKLQELGDEIRLALQSHPQILHTTVSMPRGEPRLWLAAADYEAQRSGLTLSDLARQLDGGLEGSLGGSIFEQTEEIPVRVRLGDRRDTVDSLGSFRFTTARGAVPLESIGELELRPELAGITRYDGQRCNTVSGYVEADALPIDVGEEVLARLEQARFELPAGYRMELGGAAEEDSQAVGSLLTYAPVLFTIMLATIVLVFRSLRIALLLVAVAILSVGMAFLSTWSMGFPISFNTILGTLGLIGVALNDSIVVLAAIRENPRARAGDRQAIVEEVVGCSRHVLSTTLTTMGGFLPLLLFIGGSFWPSLAIVLAGGVAGATILALLFVPAMYGILHRLPEQASQLAAQPTEAPA